MKYTNYIALSIFTAGACFAQTITTIAGVADEGFGGDGGPAALGQFSSPASLAADAAGNLYVIDSNNVRVRKISPDGSINTAAGSGDISDPVLGLATQSGFISIYDIAVSSAGILHIADADGLQRVDATGNLSFVVTGTSVPAIAISNTGTIYLADAVSVSRLEQDGSTTRVAGTDLGDSGDGGPAMQAEFYVTAMATDRAGSLFILDGQSSRVRKITADGTIATLAGTGMADFSGDGGPANQASLNLPAGIAVDVAGNIYISDTRNNRIRKVTSDGAIVTFAGTGDTSYDGDGGPALQASLGYPANLAVSCTALYINDSNRVRAVALTAPLIGQNGVVSTTTSSTTVKAGGQFSISGCNLAATAAKADPAGPSTFTLAGASVTVNGIAVALVAVSPIQITAQFPASVAPGTATVSVLVNGNGTASTTVSVN